MLCLCTILLVYPIYKALEVSPQIRPGLSDSQYGLSDLPIISAGSVISAGLFLSNMHYAPQPERYIYVVDQDVSFDTGALYMDTMMAALGHHYLPDHVIDVTNFLATHDAFFLLHSPEWFETRVINNSTYNFRILRKYTDPEGGLVLVQKVQ